MKLVEKIKKGDLRSQSNVAQAKEISFAKVKDEDKKEISFAKVKDEDKNKYSEKV